MKVFGARKGQILLLVVSVLATVVGIAWWRAHSRPTLSFTTATVKRGSVVASIGATGTIEPMEVVDVGAQVAGRINTFGKDKSGATVDYGSVVEEGALLAKIDDSVYAADLSVARAGELSAAANLEQMNAKLDQATADWKRAQELFASKLISQVDYDTAKASSTRSSKPPRTPTPASLKSRLHPAPAPAISAQPWSVCTSLSPTAAPKKPKSAFTSPTDAAPS
jgi:multidrug efflux pump subunit AcrA (membrane-fusion protein)